ncbi:MAG: hypothetical protein OXC07_07780 [Kistimonas sp.]|nr:hypothetical protein [Kistimonas sp.]
MQSFDYSISFKKPSANGETPSSRPEWPLVTIGCGYVVEACEPENVQQQMRDASVAEQDYTLSQPPASTSAIPIAQRRIDCTRFLAPRATAVHASSEPVEGLVQSPDGFWLASWSRSEKCQPTMDVILWQKQGTDLDKRETFRHPGTLFKLTFSADSHYLNAFDTEGQVQTWQRQPGLEGDQWDSMGLTALSQGVANRVALSDDGCCLVISSKGTLWVYNEVAPGQWKYQCHWPWRNPEKLASQQWYCMEPPARVVFSPNGNHLFRMDSRGIETGHREGEIWQAYAIPSIRPVRPFQLATTGTGYVNPDTSVVKGITLDAQERWLAIAFEQDKLCNPFYGWSALGLWCFENERGWQRAQMPTMPVPTRTGPEQLAMTFSPGRRELAYAEFDIAASRTCILTCLDSDIWALTNKMEFRTEPGAKLARTQMIDSLQFSATGSYLAVKAATGIQIWWRWMPSTWLKTTWVDNTWIGKSMAVFSPDGLHCAVVGGYSGFVNLYGPAGLAGNYRSKTAWFESASVTQLQFSSDGGQVLVTSWGASGADKSTGSSRLRCLALVPQDSTAVLASLAVCGPGALPSHFRSSFQLGGGNGQYTLASPSQPTHGPVSGAASTAAQSSPRPRPSPDQQPGRQTLSESAPSTPR